MQKKPKTVLYNPYKNKSNRFRKSKSQISEMNTEHPGKFITSQIDDIKLQNNVKTLKNARIKKKMDRRGRLSSTSSSNILEQEPKPRKNKIKRTNTFDSNRSSSSGIVYDFRASSKDKSPTRRKKAVPDTPNVTAKKSKGKISSLFSNVFSRKSSKDVKDG